MGENIIIEDIENGEDEYTESTVNKITVADILILQVALCLIIVAVLVFLHLKMPGIYDDIIANAKSEIKKPFMMSDEFKEAVASIRELYNA